MSMLQGSQPLSTTGLMDIAYCLAKQHQGSKDVEIEKSEAQDFDNRVNSVIKRLEAFNPQDDAQRESAERVLKLVEVSAKLSQLEGVANQMRSCGPVGSEAKKWQDLTSVAMDWSRNSLRDQQLTFINKIVEEASHRALGNQPSTQVEVPQAQLNKLEIPMPIKILAPSEISTPRLNPVEEPEPCTPTSKDATISSGFEQGETLRTHLEALSSEDPGCILIVRKINRLGFESPGFLEQYFKQFGGVVRVYVAHSRVKPSKQRPLPRVRPAGLGFVLMDSAATAAHAVASGPHSINNVSIGVNVYQSEVNTNE